MSRQFEQLTSWLAQWDVTLSETRETQSSLLGFGIRAGSRVVLKVSKRTGDEWHSGDVLRAFDGDGTVKVLEWTGGAVLLERLDPATELVQLVRSRDDDAATEILAGVIARMAHHKAPLNCPTVADWGRGFNRGPFDQIPGDLFHDAHQLHQKLESSQGPTMLLHGDLHHYNVLFDTNRGWVVIDPKGVVGELEYELGAMIRNPVESPERYISAEVVERRLRTLTRAMNLNYRRALEWSFAQAVLSAIWDIEDGFEVTPEHASLRLARTISPMLT
jgi:streptomycin 6-kinase